MAASRRLLRIGDYFDGLEHRALVARLPRCACTGCSACWRKDKYGKVIPGGHMAVVPRPTDDGGLCCYCYRSGCPKGSRVQPIRPPPSPEPVPIPAGEGAVAG